MNLTMTTPRKISDSAKEIAEELLRLGAVKLSVNDPFTWASGIKSPIYCENRKINSDVQARRKVLNAFLSIIKNHCSDLEFFAGVATGGISHGALIADRLDLPFVYVRQTAKEHGMMKQVEGDCSPGSKIIVIEDLISTGG